MIATRSNSLAAVRSERSAVLEFCRTLTTDEWATPSAASGWTMQDVVVHMTASIRAAITPAAIQMMLSRQVERTNDQVVAQSRSRTPEQALAEFETWSGRGIAGLTAFTAPGISRIPLRIGELGWFPLRALPGLYVFDWHTHLRHDIAPVLGRPAPPTDDQRMTAVATWLMALLAQSHRTSLNWLDAPVALALTGPGGGTWRIERTDRGRLRVRPGSEAGAAVTIRSEAVDLPLWGTARRPWPECEVVLEGDIALGTRFLNSINLV